MNFCSLFDAAAARFPDRIAIEVQRRATLERYTYRQLRDRSAAIARQLGGLRIGAGDRCAIFADNDAEWCAVYLGILRLGAVAVPLDTNYSTGQVAIVVGDSGARVLFAGERLLETARQALPHAPDVTLLRLGAAIEASPAESAFAEAVDLQPHDAAVILYTSGTTADPKGVVLTHANLIAERDAAFGVVAVSEGDSVLGVLPLFHALAQMANLLLPFSVGARVIFLETINSTELVRALRERQVTIFACVPQFFYLIHQRIRHEVNAGGALRRWLFDALLAINFRLRRAGIDAGGLLFARVHRLLGREMRLFITGGSKFDPAIGRDLYAMGFTILQAYGLTETSGAATLTRPDDAHLDTVGRALPGQEIRVDPPEDPGLDGEIAIRGPIVMREYFNRPDATAEAIQGGWLLTGDLGRLDDAGRLMITGRRKEVIVLASGKNIYPEEIEAQYRQSPFIREIAVLGLPDPEQPATERMYAVVVPDADMLRQRKIVNAGDLIRFEMEGQAIHLPPHKRVLGYEIWFEPLPRTTTGKLKRHEIRARLLDAQRRRAADAHLGDAPDAWLQDPHVAEVAEVMARRARPGGRLRPDANLELDLGLDSMERVELITELEQRFGVRLDEKVAHEIFTAGQLADAVRPGAAAPAGSMQEASWAVILRDLPPESDPILSGLLGTKPIASRVMFLISRLIRLLVRIDVSGLQHLPATTPYIISPNHQGYLDPFLICGVLPFRVFRQLFFVGAAEYFETPLTRWLARQCNCVPVDPDANLIPAMKAGAFGLAHGKILMLFPEGERSIDGTVKRFKKGSPILAQHLGVPIVPVAIDGAFALWPRNRGINWRALAPWSGHRVRISVGTPMQVSGSMGYADAATQLRDRVAAMWQQLHGLNHQSP